MSQLAKLLDDLDMEVTTDGRNLLDLQISMRMNEPRSSLNSIPNLDRLCNEILDFIQVDLETAEVE